MNEDEDKRGQISDEALVRLQRSALIAGGHHAFTRGTIKEWEAENGPMSFERFTLEDMALAFALCAFADGDIDKGKNLLRSAGIEFTETGASKLH